MSKIYVTGLGPGAKDQMTIYASRVLEHCPVIIGYTVYIDLIRDQFPDKQYLSTPMRREADRCRMAFEEAEKGQDVAMVCSGDAGVYGMAGLICEIGKDYPQVEIEIVPGITAAEADFVICLYNPSSRKRSDYLEKACGMILESRDPKTVCGIARNIGRDGESCRILTLEQLKDTKVDMFSTVFIGNSKTMELNGRMVTPRGYKDV